MFKLLLSGLSSIAASRLSLVLLSNPSLPPKDLNFCPSGRIGHWTTPRQSKDLAEQLNMSVVSLRKALADICIVPSDSTFNDLNLPISEDCFLLMAIDRLQEIGLREKASSVLAKKNQLDKSFPIEGIMAAQETLRWCDNFVAGLGLCPWARQSLIGEGCTRIIVVEDDGGGLQKYERVVRQASRELVDRTNPSYDDGTGAAKANPDLAITFIVSVCEQGALMSPEFEFDTFNDFVNDLESELFQQADEGIDDLGDLVTIAGFHPGWTFANEQSVADAVNYEKRAPYPTISVVLTDAIIRAGEESSEKIGKHNELVLSKMGSLAVQEYYAKHVKFNG